MSNKFIREGREFARLFCLEHVIDPDLARSNLETRLEDKRKRIHDWAKTLIQEKLPGVDLDG